MNLSFRKITLAAVATASAGFCAWHFWPTTSLQTVATIPDASVQPTDGPLDARAPGASPILFSQNVKDRDGASQPTVARLSAEPERGSLAATAVPRGTRANPVGAIRAGTPNRSRPTAATESAELIAEAPRRRLIIEAILPVPASGQPLATSATPRSDLQIDLAPGVREPIALVEATADLSSAQVRAVTGVANDFVDRVEQAADTLGDADFEATWAAEQANADAQYSAIFGADAYNRKLAETAANAIAGKPTDQPAAPEK